MWWRQSPPGRPERICPKCHPPTAHSSTCATLPPLTPTNLPPIVPEVQPKIRPQVRSWYWGGGRIQWIERGKRTKRTQRKIEGPRSDYAGWPIKGKGVLHTHPHQCPILHKCGYACGRRYEAGCGSWYVRYLPGVPLPECIPNRPCPDPVRWMSARPFLFCCGRGGGSVRKKS